MVFHPEAGWGGLSTPVQKTKIYVLRIGTQAPRHFQKKHLAGAFCTSLLAGIFQKLFGGNFFKKHLAGTFKKHLVGKFSKTHLAGTFWQEHFGGKLVFFNNSKIYKMIIFLNKGSETQP